MNIEEIIANIMGLEKTFIGEAPVDINNCQWITKTSGPSIDHFDDATYDKLGFKIYVRGDSNEESNKRMNDIYKALKSYVGANYVIIVPRLPHYIGRDVQYRVKYALNIEIQLGGY